MKLSLKMRGSLLALACAGAFVVGCANEKKSDGAAAPSSAQAGAPAEKPDPRAAILNQYTYEELNKVATYFVAVVERPAKLKGKQILKCDPPVAKASMWLSGPLRSLIDDKTTEIMESLQANQKGKSGEPASEPNTAAAGSSPVTTPTSMSHEALQSKAKNCLDECLCNAYLRLAEAAGEQPGVDQKAHAKVIERLKQANKKQNAKLDRQCAEKQEWFCGSDLEKYLEAMANEELP